MNNFNFSSSTGIFKNICAILFLISQAACAHDPQTITGQVVDESGVAISNVEVKACYSGWGWSGNSLVWDKDYCSEPVMTDSSGLYVIDFKGSGYIRLMGKKEGWIQTRDFNAKASRIILTRLKTHIMREAERKESEEKKFRTRLQDESNAEYFCRVILNRSGKITLNYMEQKIVVCQTLINYNDQTLTLFVLHGSHDTVSSFSREMVLRISGKEVDTNFFPGSDATACQSDIYFIETDLPQLSTKSDMQIEVLIPSINAMFDVNIWPVPFKTIFYDKSKL